jgi:hypothetical protein
LGGRDRQISEFEASLVYRVRSRKARASQRNPVSKNQKKKKKNKQTKNHTVSALTEDTSSVPSTHMMAPNHL